ncbi:hypothetical protein [Nocardia farcinica]|uniref:hypothetical protein n=1 Tax=Nocardia farcinica TaxID=37329 RepID=UPI001893B7B1|nr:hypothetical protein [Nocardia farcinica]MBF6268124.1 hypothetical protein [Nocardia farcinica]MBF6295235.1 hypothetical protein [Nocardia farcinica]MBF6381675.1 hypothetical protein [Nocardia farcinica]
MSAPATRSAAVPGRTLAVLGALGALSVVAFVLAPAPVAARTAGGGFGDEAAVRAAFRAAFTGYWNSGSRDLPPDAAHLVEFWSHYHLVKALAAVAALIAFAATTVLVWQALARTGRHRAVLRTAGVLATALAAVAAVLTLAMSRERWRRWPRCSRCSSTNRPTRRWPARSRRCGRRSPMPRPHRPRWR